MKETLVVCLLAMCLTAPDAGEFPPDELVTMAANLPDDAFERFKACAGAMNLHFPDRETFDRNEIRGAYLILWRRGHGRPLDYPDDPVLGVKKP